MSKGKVAPPDPPTAPRLELQAAVLTSSVHAMLSHEIDFEVDQTHCWTDSQIVLGYLKNETRRYNTYVANSHKNQRQNHHTLLEVCTIIK